MTADALSPLQRLSDLISRLRGPDGCPWDREQRLGDLRAYLLEEAHEVAAAIDTGDWPELCGELGDLLFQVVFIGQLAAEEGQFTLDDIVNRIEAKMIARHPHVFGDDKLSDSQEVHRAWERRKLASLQGGRSLLAGVPTSLPALVAAYRMTQKAAGVGFDWEGPEEVSNKLDEELGELREEIAAHQRAGASQGVREELGDLLFTMVNLARHLKIDPEAALAAANAKFRRRFQRVEEIYASRQQSLAAATLEELEETWQQVKSG